MKLWEIAHARSGDKGDTANIVVVCQTAKYWPLIEEYLVASRVQDHFEGVVRGDVVRYSIPHLHALNFVMKQALGGGVTRSLRLDIHGKGLASQLLDMDIPDVSGSGFQ